MMPIKEWCVDPEKMTLDEFDTSTLWQNFKMLELISIINV